MTPSRPASDATDTLARDAAEKRALVAECQKAHWQEQALFAERRALTAERERDEQTAQLKTALAQAQRQRHERLRRSQLIRVLRGLRRRLAAAQRRAMACIRPTPEAVPAPTSVTFIDGNRPRRAGRPVILVIGAARSIHPSEETPSLAHLCRLLGAHADLFIWLLDDAPPDSSLRAEACTLIAQPAGYIQAPAVLDAILRHTPCTLAVMQGSDARSVLPALHAAGLSAGLPSLSLVHEYQNDPLSPYLFQEIIFWSTHTVFTNHETRLQAAAFWPSVRAPVMSTHPWPVPVPPATGTADAPASRRCAVSRRRALGQRIILGHGDLCHESGTDLFLECAAHMITLAGPDHRLHFVWAGAIRSGPAYERYAHDVTRRIQRLNLGAHLTMLAPDALPALWPNVDLLILTARDDRLMPVAVHALRQGCPLVCLDQAATLARILAQHALDGPCVAHEGTPASLAGKALDWLSSDASRTTAQLQAAVAHDFDEARFAAHLEALGERAQQACHQAQADAASIAASGRFMPAFVAPEAEDIAEATAIRHYLAGWHSGLATRRPCPEFHPGIYREQHMPPDSLSDPFADYLRAGAPDGPWCAPLIRSTDAPFPLPAPPSVALHIHAYWPALLDGMLERLAHNQMRPPLYISVKSEEDLRQVHDVCARRDANVACVRVVPNRGRDIGPFLSAFGPELCRFEIVGHLHTKQSLHVHERERVDRWRHFLLENLLGGAAGGAMMDRIIATMHARPGLGLVFPGDPQLPGWDHNHDIAVGLAERLGLAALPAQFSFPVGTMFWMRSAVLEHFLTLELDWDSYPEEPLGMDGSLLHALERLFGVVPEHLGLDCGLTWVAGTAR